MYNDRIWNLIAKKLAGEATAADLKELETVLRLDPDLHYSLEAVQDMWRKHAEPETDQAQTAYQKHIDRMQSMGMDMGNADLNSSPELVSDPPRRFFKTKMVLLTISGFILISLGLHFYNPHKSTAQSSKPLLEVVTRNGTKTSLLLPDGTTVWLNAGSRLTYDSLYGNSLREVTLSGEAFFEVVKNPKKPFLIHVGKINIRVLGTVFNVKSYPGEKTIETSLIKGSIEVTFPSISSKKIILKPNQKLVINKMELTSGSPASQAVANAEPFISIRNLSKTGADSSFEETAWMQNRFYFNDMSFKELLMNMERKYGVSFRLTDPALDTIHFTGSFQNETISQALDALRFTAEKSTADFTYEMQDNQVLIYNTKSGVHSILPK
jgi:transmembrane sensor